MKKISVHGRGKDARIVQWLSPSVKNLKRMSLSKLVSRLVHRYWIFGLPFLPISGFDTVSSPLNDVFFSLKPNGLRNRNSNPNSTDHVR